MKKENILLIVFVVIACILGGFLVSRMFKAPQRHSSAPTAEAPPPVHLDRIRMLKGLLAKDPGNHDAWVKLGDAYFDAHQPKEAVDAYSRALKLVPDDPSVLTDQGVMFRRLGWFDKAVQNFKKANRIDPTQVQSLYNLGVVYRYDLKNLAKAKEAWTRFLKIEPNGPGADHVRQELKAIESLSGPPGGK